MKVEVGSYSNTQKEMEGISSQVKQEQVSDWPNASYLPPIEVKNEGGSHMENMLQSKFPPIKSEPCDASNDDDEKQLVPLQNFQFVEVDNEDTLKSEIDIIEEMFGTESEVFASKMRDGSSLMSSSDQIKIISAGGSNAGNFMLEIQGDATCPSTVKETPLKKQLSLESANTQQTLDIQHNYIRFQVCPNCESIFTSPEELASHQLNCNFISVPVEPEIAAKPYSKCQSQFPCTFCNKVLTSELNLDRHLLIHTEESVSKCRFCDKMYHNKDLEEHLKIHKFVQTFSCDIGNKLVSGKYNFISHRKLHAGQRPYTCDHCGKSFTLKGSLIDHIRIHTGELPYTCNHCGKSFTWKGSLIYHIRAHTGERPFACQLCGKSFRNKQNLGRHIATHTEEPFHSCEFCGKSFAQKSTPAAHVKLHVDELPFVCD